MKKAISIFLILGLVAVGYLVYSSANKRSKDSVMDQSVEVTPSNLINTENKSNEGKPSRAEEIPDGWKILTNKDHSIKYPSEATAVAREEESLIYYMGQKQIDSGRTQTELFDGYSFRVGKIRNVTTNDLKQLALSERNNTMENCNNEDGVVSDLLPVKVGGQGGFQYSAKGCYIDYTETIVGFDGNFYRISQSYVGDNEDYAGYKETTNMILATLEFFN